jgi:iron complex outermembrane recepter protein
MFKKSKVSTGVLVALGGALLVGAGSGWAQERIEVTGSRIKSIGNTSSSPITSVGKADIDTTQPVAVEELVKGLPSAYPAIGPNINNGSNGTASIDLRGMGTNRTLVLFNGKRFVPAVLEGVVDTNNVPVALLERVDLVTGGASAVYGADAVAGVVNFVMKRNFSGVEASTLYSVSAKNDARRYKSDLTIGTNLADGRGNVAISIGTTRTLPLRLGDRDFSTTTISSATGAPGGFSSTAVPATFQGMPSPINGNQVIDATTGLLRTSSAPNAPDGYNTNPPNYFETPLTRTQVAGIGRFSINEYVEAYTEVFHTRSNVTLNLAPSGTFGATLSIPVGNPFIPQAVRQQICSSYLAAELAKNPNDPVPSKRPDPALIAGLQQPCVAGNPTEIRAGIARRFVEAGPRIYSYDNVSTQYTFGFRGAIPYLDSWSYDAYYQAGRSDQQVSTGNGFSATKLQNAVRSVNGTTCTIGGSCVPVNLFGAAGTITQPMLDYLSTPTFRTTEVRQDVIALSANGEVGLVTSPFAKNPLGVAVGFEQRTVFGGNKSDAVIQTSGELLGSGAPTPDRSGELKFTETYAELSLPLVQKQPFFESLGIQGGYRDTKLSTSAGTSQSYGSWKAGGDWSPMKGLRFRGEQQRATRAPNVNELYAPITTGLSTINASTGDFCSGAKINAADAGKAGTLTALCQATGVPTSQIGALAAPSANQINNTGGGNPNLQPEKADTTTLGLVWEPDFVDNLSISLDYWKIKVKGAVGSASANQIMAGCYDSTTNPGYSVNVFCQLIQRDPLTGGLNGTGSKGVITQSSNLGQYDYSGFDIGATYRLPLKNLDMPTMGRIDFKLDVSLLQKADILTVPGTPTIVQAGYYGVDVGTPYAKTRFNQRTTWNVGDFSVGYLWRFIGATAAQQGTTLCSSTTPPQKQPCIQDENTTIKAFNYFDLNGSWQAMKNLKLSLTVNNAFDKKPPLVGTGVAGSTNVGNTFPTLYDAIGRRYTLTATANF